MCRKDGGRFPAVPLLQPRGREECEQHEFKLTVHVLSAFVPAQHAPAGVLSNHRLLLDVSLAEDTHEIEAAGLEPFRDGAHHDSISRPCSGQGPSPRRSWHFRGGTLSFTARLDDLVGPGLRLSLRTRSEVSLGPLTLRLSQAVNIGEAVVDLQRCVLPACIGHRRHGAGSRSSFWESPEMVIPCVGPQEDCAKEAKAHLKLIFATNVDPARLLTAAEPGASPCSPAVSETRQAGWLWQLPLNAASIVEAGGCSLGLLAPRHAKHAEEECGCWASNCHGQMERSTEGRAAGDRTGEGKGKTMGLPPLAAARPMPGGPGAFKAPEQSPEGWVCRRGPSGRMFWHHTDLGPAPWDCPPAEMAEDNQAFARSLMGQADRLHREEEERGERIRAATLRGYAGQSPRETHTHEEEAAHLPAFERYVMFGH